MSDFIFLYHSCWPVDAFRSVLKCQFHSNKSILVEKQHPYWSICCTSITTSNFLRLLPAYTQLEDVRSRFQNAAPQHQPPPCREYKQRLVDCLRTNPNETLRCTSIVDEFTQCVGQYRTQLLDAKHSAKAAPPPAAQTKTAPVVAAHWERRSGSRSCEANTVCDFDYCTFEWMDTDYVLNKSGELDRHVESATQSRFVFMNCTLILLMWHMAHYSYQLWGYWKLPIQVIEIVFQNQMCFCVHIKKSVEISRGAK